MVQRLEKTLYRVKGSYYLVVPKAFVKEHGLEDDRQVEVFYNGELLVRPMKRASPKVDEVVHDEPA